MFSLTRHFIRTGNAARDTGAWPDAQRAYRRALAWTPGLAHIWVQYGHALRETGDFAAALAAYRKSDALRPDQADTHLQIGRTLVLLGQADDALQHLDRSAALAGQPSDADTERSTVLARLPRRAAAPTPAVRGAGLVPRPPGMPDRLRFLNLGTTGTCNASCIHCPTGKAETAHVPRGTMPMALFQKIIDGIADHGLTVTDQIAFGLFGDGLVDPLVLQRAEYLRARLPNVRVSVNTNGAAFNAAKHAALHPLVDTLALHCESVTESTYNHLMQPLRWERVRPKIEAAMLAFPGKVVVSVPISTRNRAEAPAIRQWFEERGAREVVFDPLSSRCAEDRTAFDALALNPRPIRCPSEIMDDLIVDCDGQVLVCCQDFQRIEGIGSLLTESFADVMVGAQRHRVRTLLGEGRHEQLATCSRCYADIRGEFIPA